MRAHLRSLWRRPGRGRVAELNSTDSAVTGSLAALDPQSPKADSTMSRSTRTFLGVERTPGLTYGPFRERGSLDGVLIRVGGKDDTVPVHLLDGDKVHICNTNREVARLLAPSLFGPNLRVHGEGRWERDQEGKWNLLRFDIRDFEPLRRRATGRGRPAAKGGQGERLAANLGAGSRASSAPRRARRERLNGGDRSLRTSRGRLRERLSRGP